MAVEKGRERRERERERRESFFYLFFFTLFLFVSRLLSLFLVLRFVHPRSQGLFEHVTTLPFSGSSGAAGSSSLLGGKPAVIEAGFEPPLPAATASSRSLTVAPLAKRAVARDPSARRSTSEMDPSSPSLKSLWSKAEEEEEEGGGAAAAAAAAAPPPPPPPPASASVLPLPENDAGGACSRSSASTAPTSAPVTLPTVFPSLKNWNVGIAATPQAPESALSLSTLT